MPKYRFNKVFKINESFKGSRADLLPLNPELKRFSTFLWAGNDEGIWCVYRQDPKTKEVVRIEFFAPERKRKV